MVQVSRFFVVLSICTVMLVGSLTLLSQALYESHASQAATQIDSAYVIGPPSLPASTIDAIFARMGSPMQGTGTVVEKASRQANIDDAFALGIWEVETSDGAAGVGLADRNPGSIRGSDGYPSAYDGYTIYPSYAAAITDWFNVLKSRYISRGLTSAYTICYPYVGTSSAPLWAGKVTNLMGSYRGEAPPPTPTPSIARPTASPSPHAQLHASASSTSHTQGKFHLHTQGELQESAAVSTSISQQHTTTVQSPVGQTVVQSEPRLPWTNELAIICLGLLSAVSIASWGIRVRRSIPIHAVSTLDSHPQTEPLFVSQFSPVIERHTSQLLHDWSLPEQQIPVSTGTTGGGLLTRYPGASAERRNRRVLLLSIMERE